MELPVRNCRYGRDIGIPVLMNFVMVLAYAIVAPLILPFGLLYFVFLWPVWRYQVLYVYQRQYESGGQMWPLVAHKMVGCLHLMVIFTGLVFIFKAAYTQAALLFVILPIYLIRFDLYLKLRYDAVVEQVPLMAVHAAGRVEAVDPALWTPPPLREGAAGWSPEWGKTWAWWGIPRYTL
jgi:Calcium-dependent channel, 7TM region, putative phosphate